MKRTFMRQAALPALLLSMLISHGVLAQTTSTWTGAGADNNWSTVENWGGIAPVDGDALLFSGNSRLVNTNNLTLNSNTWVQFDSAGFNLYGNPLTLVQGLTNTVGTNVLSLNTTWTNASRTLLIGSGSELVIAGTNTVWTGDHTYTGGGLLRLTGTHIQPSNNPATIFNNIEYVVDGGSFSSAGGVRITSGTTPSASKLILTNSAVMNQTLAAGAIRVGDIASVSGQLIIENSTLNHMGGNIFIPFAASGIGSISQNGGALSNADIAFCNGASGNGTYNMVGGVLEAVRIRKVNATTTTAAISFDGSTLRVNTNAPTAFFTGLTTAEIKSGGLTLNSTISVTVGQSFSGAGRLTKTGGGTVTFTGTNVNDGLTENGGTALLNSANTFTNVTLSSGALQIANDAAVGGPLALNGGTIRGNNGTARTLGAPITLGGNVTFANNDLTFTGPVSLTGNRTLTVNNTNTFSNTITETSGPRTITKAGSGVLQLTVANNYSGDTTVTAGTLKVTNPTGSATGSGTVIVTNTGVVTGTGKIGNLAMKSGGKVAPGTGVGSLSVSNTTFAASGVYQVEVSDADPLLATGVGRDFLNIQGTLDISATSATPFVIELSSIGGSAANFDNTQTNSWVIATASGGITGFASDKFTVTTNNFQNNLGSGAFTVSASGNNLLLNFGAAATPQPTLNSTVVGAGTSNAQITFSSVSGANYTVQYKTNLNQVGWLNLTNFTATGSSSTAVDNTSPVPAERYYRILTP